MAKNNFYAVKVGRETGIFNTWSECKAQIDKYKGAVYKGFVDKQSAINYLTNKDTPYNVTQKIDSKKCVTAYVDGSFSEVLQKYSFGSVVFEPNVEGFKQFYGIDDDSLSLQSKNVAGELLGVTTITTWAIKNHYKQLLFIYDYEGIEKWVTGIWKANTVLTQTYVEFMKSKMNEINIFFEKVVAHSGDKYNDMADKLAKYALTNTEFSEVFNNG